MALAIVLITLSALSVNSGSDKNGTLLALLAGLFALHGLISARQLRLRSPAINRQIRVQLSVDFGLLLVLVFLGNTDSNYASLLFVPTVAGSLLLKEMKAYTFAALSSLALLAIETERVWLSGIEHGHYSQAGMLGVVFFSIAVIGRMISSRLAASQTQLEQTDINLANLEAASSLVIQNLDSGVVVIDGDNRIRLINSAAVQMLNVNLPVHGRPARDSAPLLSEQIALWKMDQRRQIPSFTSNGRDLVPRFVPVGQMGRSGILVFLDDAEQLSTEAQQNKLASLGQLTASIAHEIRNPLSAISHASQLLAESPTLDEADVHLTEIIKEQVVRVDSVISSVLKLSRREKPQPVIVKLAPWLEQFRSCFILEHQLQISDFEIESNNTDAEVRMDESQLDQIVSNLCKNALHYSQQNNAAAPLVSVHFSYDAKASCWYLDVSDRGPGIPEAIQTDIFVPFFTTRHEGTGLGLYLARSLCETNGARLVLNDSHSGGTTFRVIFTSPLH
jgi:two-component system sensor histidine kinase PilS (NtrC family)